jgi:hypothetical protein
MLETALMTRSRSLSSVTLIHRHRAEYGSSYFAQQLDEAAGQRKRMIGSDKGNGKHTSLRFGRI